jgi:hypothetical protein
VNHAADGQLRTEVFSVPDRGDQVMRVVDHARRVVLVASGKSPGTEVLIMENEKIIDL